MGAARAGRERTEARYKPSCWDPFIALVEHMLQCEIKRHITPNGYYLIKIHTTLTPNEEPERCSNTSKGPSLQLHVSRLLEVEAKTTNCLVTWGRCNLPLRHTVLWGQYGKENIVSSNNAGFTPQMQASLR